MTRVLIVDDHPVVRSGLRALLDGADGVEVVGAAASGEEALMLASETHPDVVLCDLRLGPGLDGVGVTAALQAQQGGPAVLILTTYDNDSDIARAVLAGAAGYLLKDAEPEDIVSGIQDAAAGRLVLTSWCSSKAMVRRRLATKGADASRIMPLSRRYIKPSVQTVLPMPLLCSCGSTPMT